MNENNMHFKTKIWFCLFCLARKHSIDSFSLNIILQFSHMALWYFVHLADPTNKNDLTSILEMCVFN